MAGVDAVEKPLNRAYLLNTWAVTKPTDGNGVSLRNAPDASGKALGVFMDIDDYDDEFGAL